MTSTTRNATHDEIHTLITARAVYGDDAAMNWCDAPRAPIAAITPEYVRLRGVGPRYRIATLEDGTRWLAVQRRSGYAAVFSVARLARVRAA